VHEGKIAPAATTPLRFPARKVCHAAWSLNHCLHVAGELWRGEPVIASYGSLTTIEPAHR
jgi:hypothetical protein